MELWWKDGAKTSAAISAAPKPSASTATPTSASEPIPPFSLCTLQSPSQMWPKSARDLWNHWHRDLYHLWIVDLHLPTNDRSSAALVLSGSRERIDLLYYATELAGGWHVHRQDWNSTSSPLFTLGRRAEETRWRIPIPSPDLLSWANTTLGTANPALWEGLVRDQSLLVLVDPIRGRANALLQWVNELLKDLDKLEGRYDSKSKGAHHMVPAKRCLVAEQVESERNAKNKVPPATPATTSPKALETTTSPPILKPPETGVHVHWKKTETEWTLVPPT